jgi:UrcA family protein
MNTKTQLTVRSISPLISIRAVALVALVALFAFTSDAALADQPPATRIAKVSLAGLDLSTLKGARIAYERIKTTAERLCFQLADPRKIDYQAVYNVCVNEALADTVRRINSPTVAALEK